MSTILERIQEKYPGTTDDARNIAEAVGMVFGTGGRGSGNIAGVLYSDITLTFDPNGGTGSSFTKMYVKNSQAMDVPECPFTPPEGKVFHYWYFTTEGTDEEQGRLYPGHMIGGVSDDFIIYAIWKDAE